MKIKTHWYFLFMLYFVYIAYGIGTFLFDEKIRALSLAGIVGHLMVVFILIVKLPSPDKNSLGFYVPLLSFVLFWIICMLSLQLCDFFEKWMVFLSASFIGMVIFFAGFLRSEFKEKSTNIKILQIDNKEFAQNPYKPTFRE